MTAAARRRRFDPASTVALVHACETWTTGHPGRTRRVRKEGACEPGSPRISTRLVIVTTRPTEAHSPDSSRPRLEFRFEGRGLLFQPLNVSPLQLRLGVVDFGLELRETLLVFGQRQRAELLAGVHGRVRSSA